MKFKIAFLFIFLSFNAWAQNIWFSDNFNNPKLGNIWFEISGRWGIENGRLKLKATDKPALLGLNLPMPPNSRYTVKFGFYGKNVLIMFNVYELYSMTTGNYVKFFNSALYTGKIELNGDENIKKFVSLPSTLIKAKLNEITIEVTPEKYILYFNNRKVLEEKPYFKSGDIIIGVSDGEVEIDYFIISSKEKYKTIEDLKKINEPLIDRISSIAIMDSSKFAISSDVYSQVQIVDMSGNLVHRFAYLRWAGGLTYVDGGLYICDAGRISVVFPGRSINVGQFMVKYPSYVSADPERFYVIDDGAVKIFNRDFRLISSFMDPDNLKFPSAITSDKYNIYCADPVLGHIVVYSKRETKLVGKIKDKLIAPVDVKYDSTSNSLFVADAGLRAVVKITGDKVEKVFKCENFGGLKFPRSIDLKDNIIFIADADKIVSVDATLSEASVRLILSR